MTESLDFFGLWLGFNRRKSGLLIQKFTTESRFMKDWGISWALLQTLLRTH